MGKKTDQSFVSTLCSILDCLPSVFFHEKVLSQTEHGKFINLPEMKTMTTVNHDCQASCLILQIFTT